MNVGLSKVAVRLPGRIESVDDILVRTGSGPRERRVFAKIHGLRDSPTLAPGERMEDLLVEAGRAVLDGGPVGMVLYGHTLLLAELDLWTEFRDRLRSRLGLTGSRFYGVSHINCTSVLRSVDLARRYLSRPGADPDERVLVLGGDQGSRQDVARIIPGLTVAGDGVAAVLVRGQDAADQPRYRYLAGAYARDVRFHRTMRMSPEEFGQYAKVCGELAVEAVRRAAKAAGIGFDEVDWVMPHLSNRTLWRNFALQTGMAWDRICLDLLPLRGHNFGTDSLMALEHADRTGRLRPGDRCALVAVGQGTYTQAAIVEVTENS